jgi:hypothetical protein
VNLTRKPPQALLYVQPKMTKFEVKEYLSKIYNVKVLHVNTANFLGKSIIEKPLFQESINYEYLFSLFTEIRVYDSIYLIKASNLMLFCCFFTFFGSLLCFIFVLGKWKRFYGKNRIIAYKRRNFKKALG